MYIEIRDAYYHLYNNEAETLTANPALREMLNRLYDNFTERFGRLNDKRNLDLIKMDARGTEILSLERYIDGKARKADIFERPVAFNPDEITHADDASEALVASLNKYGRVEPHYMASLTGTTVEGILGELKGRIYYNPETDGYEVADKFIARQCHRESRTDRGVPAGESRPRPGPGIAGGSARGDAQTHRFRRPGFQPGRTVDSKRCLRAFRLLALRYGVRHFAPTDEYGVKDGSDEREDHGAVCRQRADP